LDFLTRPELSECAKETVNPSWLKYYGLIAQNRPEGFRIRQVAAEAGIDNGTLHCHFPSKEALILGVVDLSVSGCEMVI